MRAELDRLRAPGALYVKRPAALVKREAEATEILTAGEYERHWLNAAAVNMQRKGEIQILRGAVWHEESKEWRLPIRRLKPPAPAWRKPVICAGVALTVLASIYVALITLVTPAVITALVLIGAAFVAAVLHTQRRGPGRRGVDVTVRVRVR